MNDDYENSQGNYDQRAAEDAGYAAGRVEGDWNRAERNVRDGVQDVEEFPEDVGRAATQKWDNGVNDVENAPSEAFNALQGAANWLGQKVGAVENDTERAGDYAENKYNDASNDVRNTYNNDSNEARNAYNNASNDARNTYNDASNDVRNTYNDTSNEARNMYNDASNGVDRFGDQVGNSYDQGQQQGRQEGGW